MAKQTLYDKADKRIRKWAGTVGAVLVLLGAVTGAVSWVSSQFTNAVSAQIEELKAQIEQADEKQNLAIMRLELMNLIENDPDNTIEIEILGKKYFQAGGNSWMSGYYSRYAKAHGLDTSFIVK